MPQQCPYLQEGAVPEATPDMQHSRPVKAVEWAAEHQALGRAPGTVLENRTGRQDSDVLSVPMAQHSQKSGHTDTSFHPSFHKPSHLGLLFPLAPHLYFSHFLYLVSTPLLQEVFLN